MDFYDKLIMIMIIEFLSSFIHSFISYFILQHERKLKVSEDCPDFSLSSGSDPKIVCCCMHFWKRFLHFALEQKALHFVVTNSFLLLLHFCALLKHTFSSQLILASRTKKVIVLKKKFPSWDAGTFTLLWKRVFKLLYILV